LDSYSLFELNEYIRRVVALNFAEPIWVHAEISQINENRGQYYLNLVEKEEDGVQVIAQSAAVIWYKNVLFLKKKLGKVLDSLLEDGTQVKVKVRVDHHERYGLKLVIEDIDPKYTIGQLELARQAIIEKLDKKGLLDLNESIPFSSVMQNIAVISSKTAAGYQDFIAQMGNNGYAYSFNLVLFQSAMQGHKVRAEVKKAIKQIHEDGSFDCIVIIRGGGSKMDLSAFDDYDIGVAIAESDIPIITGIGHQIDNTVADIVAHTSVKTPTAVADFLIEHNSLFEGELLTLEAQIYQLSRSIIQHEMMTLTQVENDLAHAVRMDVLELNLSIEHIEKALEESSSRLLSMSQLQLDQIENSLELLDPQKIIQRGFAAIKQNGKYIQHKKDIKLSKDISIELSDGTLTATPKK